MDGRLTWTDCDEAGDYVVPNVLSPRDLVFRPDNMDETVPHKVNLVNDDVFIRFGLILFFHSQDIVYPYAYTKFIKQYKEK